MTAGRRIFPARTEAIPEVTAFVEGRCRELGAEPQATLRLALVAEELFVNVALHGYRNGPGEVTLTVSDAGDELELTSEDGAPPFDPFKDVRRPRTMAAARGAKVGGLGRVLIAAIATRHAYARRGGRNRVTVAVSKGRVTGVAKKTRKKS